MEKLVAYRIRKKSERAMDCHLMNENHRGGITEEEVQEMKKNKVSHHRDRYAKQSRHFTRKHFFFGYDEKTTDRIFRCDVTV